MDGIVGEGGVINQPVRAEGLGRNVDGGLVFAHAVGVQGIQETVLGDCDVHSCIAI